MQVLFFMKHPGSVRNFESALVELVRRGHRVRLVFDAVKSSASLATVRTLALEHSELTVERAPRLGGRRRRVDALRRAADYLRYLEPRYAGATKLRARAGREAPAALRRVLRLPLAASPPVVALLGWIVRAAERRVPPPGPLVDWIAAAAPDVVLVTPLVGIGSRQADYLRAAKNLGIPTGYPVHSWDNLTNKGLLRDVPDLTLVWNDAQATEAVELHGVPRHRIEPVGATAFDHWFDWEPSRGRTELLGEVGLDPGAPLVLYVCSSPFIAPEETTFVRRWLGQLRARGGELARIGVIVRPHPQNAQQWAGFDLADANAAVWPPEGEDPLDETSRRNYYDSIHHAAAVVGVNTSALVEAAILRRPVLTVLDPEFRETQEGTLHFQHLARGAGHLQVASTFEEHAAQLEGAIRAEPGTEERADAFVLAFLRPHGLDVAAAPGFADAIERLAARGVRRRRPSAAGTVLSRINRRRNAPPPAGTGRAVVRGLRAELASLVEQGAGAPIVAGPWHAEVGYELLYWIPFLRWACEVEPGLRDRLVVVSRGGAAPWYADVARQYVELFDSISPTELQSRLATAAGETGGLRKQMRETTFDRELLSAAGVAVEGGVLHPATMFRAHRQLLKLPVRPKDEPFRYERLSPPSLQLNLPERYVAVRFYSSAALPESEPVRACVEGIVTRLAAAGDVVVLEPGTRIDDHADFELAEGNGIRSIPGPVAPRDNLAIQTAVVAGADAFVGTYGGISYLPPLLGVGSLALYAEPGRFRPYHLDRAQRVFRDERFGSFTALHVAEVDLLATALGADSPRTAILRPL